MAASTSTNDISIWLRDDAGGSRSPADLLTGLAERLLQAGLPLDRALSTLSGIMPPGAMRQLIEDLRARVEGGAAFAEALELVWRGELNDAKSALAVLHAARLTDRIAPGG